MTQQNNEQLNTQQQAPTTLEEFVASHQAEWSSIVSDMNAKMKKFADLPDLQNVIYAKRQDALDYYFNLLFKVSGLNKKYKTDYASRYNYYKTNSQIRYSSDTAINAQIASDLSENYYNIELLESHARFMQETIKTIDNLIYAISNRIRIEELINNVKR